MRKNEAGGSLGSVAHKARALCSGRLGFVNKRTISKFPPSSPLVHPTAFPARAGIRSHGTPGLYERDATTVRIRTSGRGRYTSKCSWINDPDRLRQAHANSRPLPHRPFCNELTSHPSTTQRTQQHHPRQSKERQDRLEICISEQPWSMRQKLRHHGSQDIHQRYDNSDFLAFHLCC